MDTLAAYRESALHTHDIRGVVVREMIVGDKKYKVHLDKNGNPIKLSRYNEHYSMFVEVEFSATANQALNDEIEKLLKSLYTSRILGLTKGEDSGTLHRQDDKIEGGK